eukprot:TRINITY_DN15235_c0_g1_i1.p2 TRINITY_DN15235_c0_g1~~TRINITY_DN15235_c0_g1_i1.p2  ORF type:complete len:296 (+),score=72.56 TRINITY_DN15235_c0_g1_i1:129-1016(+)
MKVIIGGGSGFIGSALRSSLLRRGHAVTLLSRTPGAERISWQQLSSNGLPECDAIVQLSGANIMDKRWTDARKKELLSSRVDLTRQLVDAVQASKRPPKVFVCGSAVGIYPTSETAEYDEDYTGPVANNFAGELVQRWEEAFASLDTGGATRKCSVRHGIVLGRDGGALARMLLPFKLGLGGPMASGRQFWPWIHLDDSIGLIEHLIDTPTASGIYNGVSPQIVTNLEFARTLGKVLGRPALLPMPELVMRLLFQERTMLLSEGQKVIPKRVLESGFKYKFPRLEDALREAIAEL